MKRKYEKPEVKTVSFRISENIDGDIDQGFSTGRPGTQSVDDIPGLSDKSSYQVN